MHLTVSPEGQLSLWDRPQPDSRTLEVVQFADGNIGLIPEKQADAIVRILDYIGESEAIDFAQCGEDNEGEHIVHYYNSLRAKEESR